MAENRIRLPFFLIIMPMAAIIVLMITPSFSQIESIFQISHQKISLVITFAMIGYAIGPLFFGPPSNYYGRKVAIYIGIVIALCGMIVQIFATFFATFSVFLIGRFIAVFGASSGLVMTFAMVSDAFTGHEARKMMSHCSTVFAVMPGASVVIGGLIEQYLGLLYILFLCTLYLVGAFVFTLRAQETLPVQMRDKNSLQPKVIASKYLCLLRNPIFLRYYFIVGCCSAAIYAYGSMIPIIGIYFLQLSPSDFGLVSFFPYFAFMTTLFITGKYAHKISLHQLFYIFIPLFFCFSFLLLFLFAFRVYTVALVILPICCIFGALGPLIANCAVIANASSRDKGSASSLGVFINMSCAGIGSAVASFFPIFYPVILPVFLLFLVIMITFLAIHKTRI